MKKAEEVYIIDQIINQIMNFNFSMTYSGIIVMVLATLASLLGLQVANAELTTTVLTLAQFVGAIIAFIGRWRAGGLTVFGFKK